MTVRTIDEIFRDFVTDGVPASGPFNPHKPDIRDTLKALTEGSENFPDNRVIRLNNADEGTANNIVVTASVAIPAAAYQVLYILNVTQENTGPVTVSGAINRTFVTNTSRPIEPSYLQPGMALLCVDTGSELRLLSYGDAEAILAAAEDAAARAEAAAAGLNLPVIQPGDAGKSLIVNDAENGYELGASNAGEYESRTEVEEISVPETASFLRTAGYYAPGDGGGALYKRVATEPAHAGKVQSADGSWWELVSWPVNVKMFGAKGDNVSDDTQAFKDAYGFFKTGTDEQGGTIWVPRGHYMLSDTWKLEGIGGAFNYWIEGDGVTNTILNFSNQPSGKDGVVFQDQASHGGIRKILIHGAKRHGLVLGNGTSGLFLSQAKVSEVRIQNCGMDGIYSYKSYLISLDDVWSAYNGRHGVHFAGNHTSIIGNRVFASDNGGNGHKINGAVYCDYNAQSDVNQLYGYWFTNIRSANFRTLATEQNVVGGIYIASGSETSGITEEYQGIEGLVFNAPYNLYNAEAAENIGRPNAFTIEAYNNVPARVVVVGGTDMMRNGKTQSNIFDGNGGPIEVLFVGTHNSGQTTAVGSVDIQDVYSLFHP